MSKFSEEIKKAIEESELTLLSLSDASGLSLDHISKMRRGVRLPQDTDKVRKLIIALQRSEEESRRLMTLYKIERMGYEEWNCMKGIQRLLEYGNTLGQTHGERQEKQTKTDRAEQSALPTDVRVLHSRSEVFTFLQRMLPQISGSLYMLTGEMPETIVELLAVHLRRGDFCCEHLFSLKSLREKSGSLYNIRYVNRIMPLICAGKNYQPRYDYDEEGNAFLPNWLITDRWAVALQKDMEGGLVEWDAEKIAWIRQQYMCRGKNRRQLLQQFPSMHQWAAWVIENSNAYKAETVSGCIRPQDVKNYFVESEPCVMIALSEKILDQHLLLPEPAKSGVKALVKQRYPQVTQTKNTMFFTRKGLKRFARTGRISQYPEQIYTPFSIAERIQLLEHFRECLDQPLLNIYMFDDRQIDVSDRTYVFTTASLVHNEFTLMLGCDGAEYVSICELGISDKLSKFCHMLEDGEMVCTREECESAIEEVIAELQKTANTAS